LGASNPPRGKRDVQFRTLHFFLHDEFKHLGKLEAIETAITTIAGYKGRFMLIIQSLSALTGAYGEAGKQNFLSNTGLQVFMATADDETPNYFSKAIGEYTFQAQSISYSQARTFDWNIQNSIKMHRCCVPNRCGCSMTSTRSFLIKGLPPLQLRKVRYFSDRILKRIFESQTGALPEPAPLTIADEGLSAESQPDEPLRGLAQDFDDTV
jgi:type IV secretion system protein VirD4